MLEEGILYRVMAGICEFEIKRKSNFSDVRALNVWNIIKCTRDYLKANNAEYSDKK